MTLVKQARKGILIPFLKKVAAEERLEPDELLSLLASGEIVIP